MRTLIQSDDHFLFWKKISKQVKRGADYKYLNSLSFKIILLLVIRKTWNFDSTFCLHFSLFRKIMIVIVNIVSYKDKENRWRNQELMRISRRSRYLWKRRVNLYIFHNCSFTSSYVLTQGRWEMEKWYFEYKSQIFLYKVRFDLGHK